jgi:3-phenylpropionate/trans-cinnamate dioxygenase ferredoxin reductase subunit
MQLNQDSTIAIAGASLAGLRAAETLRAEGFAGRIVMVGAEPHLPYDRPPLSKQLLARTWDMDRVRLRRPEQIDALGADLLLGRRVEQLDMSGRIIELDDGSRIAFDGLVVASGAHPRHLPGTDRVPGVVTLRTLEDCTKLSEALGEGGARVVVVGAGFIGSEVAATCHERGAHVTVVEALATPLAAVLGEVMGSACATLHADHGVDLRTGVAVASIQSSTASDGTPATPPAAGPVEVKLSDDTLLQADVVVVGIGVIPTTEWLVGSGLEIRDGVVVDSGLYAADGIVAAGDVARWQEPRSGDHIRIEHWTNAAEQSAVAARNLLVGRANALPYEPVPYFWSDQYDVKIQVLGRPSPGDDVIVVDGSLEQRRFVALYGRAGQLTAALGFGRPRQLMGYRPYLENRARFDDALSHVAT